MGAHTPDLAGCLTVFTPMIHEARERVRRGADAPGGTISHRAVRSHRDRGMSGRQSRRTVADDGEPRTDPGIECSAPRRKTFRRHSAGAFLSFAERLSDTEVSGQLLHEYSELREQVANCLEKWTGFSLEFLEHACQDWAAIEGSVLGDAPGRIVGVEGGAGDTHRNGRSVMIATLSSGARVVYKPRSLAVDVHFQELLAWLNECGAEPRFRILKYVNRGDHGWVEFVQRASLRQLRRKSGASINVRAAIWRFSMPWRHPIFTAKI